MKIFKIAILLIVTLNAFSQQSTEKEEFFEDEIKFTILYDNYVSNSETQEDWGFSCLIGGSHESILFDTGTKPEILFENAEKIGVDLNKVSTIFISHNHFDHTGGLGEFLKKFPGKTVYILNSFPDDFKEALQTYDAEIMLVNDSKEIFKNVYTTGEMGTTIKEESMIFKTSKGFIIVTGCSHQGVVDIIVKAKEITGEEPYLILGGFHLMNHSKDRVSQIIQCFEEQGLIKCGATHCTGKRAMKQFKEHYKDNFIVLGTGKEIFIKLKH